MFRELLESVISSDADLSAMRNIMHAEHICGRANLILVGVPNELLFEAADNLESYWYTMYPPDNEYTGLDTHQFDPEKYPWIESYADLDNMGYSQTALFFTFGDDLVKSGLLNLGPLKWEHYFAVQALILVGCAINSVKAFDLDNSDIGNKLSSKIAATENCMEALEAITYAEHFLALKNRSRAAAGKMRIPPKLVQGSTPR